MKSIKTLIPFIIICTLFILPITKADSRLDKLLKERSTLYKDYEFYEKQKSSFLGTKSKKDLKNIIATLKRIIVKDSEIIKEVNLLSNKKTVQVVSKTQASQDWVIELENENNRLKLLLNKTTFDYNQLRNHVEDIEASNSSNNTIFFILVLVISGLIFYIFKLRQLLKSHGSQFA